MIPRRCCGGWEGGLGGGAFGAWLQTRRLRLLELLRLVVPSPSLVVVVGLVELAPDDGHREGDEEDPGRSENDRVGGLVDEDCTAQGTLTCTGSSSEAVGSDILMDGV